MNVPYYAILSIIVTRIAGHNVADNGRCEHEEKSKHMMNVRGKALLSKRAKTKAASLPSEITALRYHGYLGRLTGEPPAISCFLRTSRRFRYK